MNVEHRNPVEPLRAIVRSMLTLSRVAASLLMLSSSSFAAEVVVPNALANADGNINNNFPWNCGNVLSQRYQQVYLGSEVGSGTITQIAFRSGGPFGPTTLTDVTIKLSTTTAALDTLSTTFEANVGADVKTVHSGDLTLSSAGAGPQSPLPFNTVISLQNGFTFVAGTGKNLLLDVNIPQCVTVAVDPTFFGNANFDAHSQAGDSISRVFDFGPAFPGLVPHDTAGLVTRFTIQPAGPPPPPTALVAAVLPSSRSVQVGTTATAFVTIINTGPNTAFAVGIALASPIAAGFKYNQTSCTTNAVIGADGVPVDIPPSGQACYVISITPSAPLAPTEVAFNFAGTNTDPVPTLVAINTLLMSASLTPVPDIVALAATATNDGILHLPGPAGASAFAVATSNVGIGDLITASANTGPIALPLALSICQTNPATGACISAIGASVAVQINAGATPTFAIFATASGAIVLDPAVNRIFLVFADGGNVVRGRTSVAVTTQ